MNNRFSGKFYSQDTLLLKACNESISDGKVMADQLYRLASRFDNPFNAPDRKLLLAAIRIIEQQSSVLGLMLAREYER